MAAAARASSADSLGAWLLKARGAEPETQAHVRSAFVDVETRCVRPSYRTDLVVAGQPALLWVSGNAPGLPAGIYAHGRTTGLASDGAIPVRLSPLLPPLLRSELLGHPVLSGMEVLRMPAGSNPSYVTRGQLAALTDLSPGLRN